MQEAQIPEPIVEDYKREARSGGYRHVVPAHSNACLKSLLIGYDKNGQEQGDPRLFEVVCGDCGDTGGLKKDQTEAVKKLRGPYHSQAEASAAAGRHLMETGYSSERPSFVDPRPREGSGSTRGDTVCLHATEYETES